MTTTRTSTRTTTTRTERRSERGVALILVVWTFAALAVLAAEFARAMHDEAASARNFKEAMQARYVAMAGLSEGILALQANRRIADFTVQALEDEANLDPLRSLAQGDGQWIEAMFRGQPYEVRVVDEGGKLALNVVNRETLRTVLANLDFPDDQAETIADSIIDWRDEDDFHQPNGAEDDYYESLDRPYRAKNGSFDTLEELLLVRGVTTEAFYGSEEFPGLRELFSVYNTSHRINMRSMSPAVMRALSGIDADEAEQLRADRRVGGDAVPDRLRELVATSPANARASTPTDMTIEVRVAGIDGETILAHIGAVVKLSTSGDSLRVYRWYDSIFGDSDRTGHTTGEIEHGEG